MSSAIGNGVVFASLRIVRDVRFDFNGARLQIGIRQSFRAHAYLAGDFDHKLGSQRFRQIVYRCIGCVKDNLRDAFAVSQIDKYELAVIPADIHPPFQGRGLTGAGYGQFPTCMRAFQTICSPIDRDSEV